MTLNIRTEESSNEPIIVDAGVSVAVAPDADIRHVAGLLQSFLAEQTIGEVDEVASAGSGPSEKDLKEMMKFLYQCVQEIQINLGKLNQSKDGFAGEIGKAQLTSAINAAKEAAEKYAEYERQKAEAAKAQEAMKVFGFILMALAVVVGALTGGFAGLLMAGLMVALQASGTFEKLTEALQNECGLTKEQANAVVFAIVLAASLGTSVASVALKGAVNVAEKTLEKAVENAAEKVIRVLKEGIKKDIFMNLATAAGTSGVVADFACVIVDAVFENIEGMSEKEKEEKKAIAKMVVTIVLMIALIAGGIAETRAAAKAAAANGESSSNLIVDGLKKLFSTGKNNPQAILTKLQSIMREVQCLVQISSSASEIGEGAITVKASRILGDDVAKAEGRRSLFTALSEGTQQSAETEREDFLSAVNTIGALLNRVMEGFSIPESEAKALAR